MRLPSVAGLLVCALLGVAHADTVELTNGDKLSGHIVSMNAGVLTLQTEYAGEVAIKWSAVATLSTDDSLTMQVGGKELQTKLAVHSAGSALTDARDVVALSAISSLSRPESPRAAWRFEGNADVAVDIDRETNDSTDNTLSLSARAETDAWRNILDVDYQRATANSETTSDHSESSYKLDRLWGKHWFTRAGMLYREDAFATIWRARGLSLGMGYRLADNDVKRFDLTASLGRFKFDLQPDAEVYVNAVLLQWDYRWRLFGTHLEVFSDGEVALPDVEGVDYVGSGNLGLRYRLSEWLYVTTRFEFDSAQLNGERSRSQHYTVGVGASW
jgi:hypothetical protein